MNNVECESCVKRKTMYCPNSFKCYATKDKPYWQNRIMLLEENNQLKEQKKELRSWLEDEIKICDGVISTRTSDFQELGGRSVGKTFIQNEILKNKVALKSFELALNKLNELEGKNE